MTAEVIVDIAHSEVDKIFPFAHLRSPNIREAGGQHVAEVLHDLVRIIYWLAEDFLQLSLLRLV